MVGNVNIISAPSKYSIPVQNQINRNQNLNQQQPAAEKTMDNERKVDWAAIGLTGAALAAIVGGIILMRKGNVSKASEVLNSSHTSTTHIPTSHTPTPHTGSTSSVPPSHTPTPHTGSTSPTLPHPTVDPAKIAEEAAEAELKKLYETYKDSFMLIDDLTFERFKELTHSAEFNKIRQMRQNVIDDKLSCKIVTDNLSDAFGESYESSLFRRSLNSTDSDIWKDIAQRNWFLSCNNAVVEGLDGCGNPIKYKDGIHIRRYYADINPMTNKLNIIPNHSMGIVAEKNGRYIRMKDDYAGELVYINPQNICEQTPRIRRMIKQDELAQLVENGESNRLYLCFDNVERNNMLVFEYNPETNQIYDSYVKNLADDTKTPIKDTNVLSELAEIFDFSQLNKKDYKSTIENMVREVLSQK